MTTLQTPFYRKMIYEKAQRILKRERYNWEPLKYNELKHFVPSHQRSLKLLTHFRFKKKEDAAVFALTR